MHQAVTATGTVVRALSFEAFTVGVALESIVEYAFHLMPPPELLPCPRFPVAEAVYPHNDEHWRSGERF